jgi:hypothetical protein
VPNQRTWTAAILGAAALISGTVVLRPSLQPASTPYTPASLSASAAGVEAATTLIVPDRSLRGGDKPTPSPSPAATAAPTAAPTTTAAATAAPTAPPPTAPPTAGTWFGVLQATAPRAAQERAAGVTAGELELNWSAYEPAPGQFDGAYAAQQKANLAGLRAAGLAVVLDVGLQYPPAWVFGVDGNTRFVNQYGDVWHGGLSEDAPNAVFDAAVRSAEAAYIQHVAADLGDSFWAVRAGGLLQDELRYPPAADNGHANSYWAFDANAQAHSPVPGWKPGQPGSAQASAFLSYYLDSLTGFQQWLSGTYRAAFPSAWLQLLKPSWGLRPGDFEAAVATGLNGSTNPAGWGTLAMGLDWQRQVAAVTDSHVMLYSSWMERGDDGTTPTTMAPAHYLATLGAARGLRTAGENADASDGGAMMSTIVQRARSWGLAGLMWLDESSLFGGGASLATYSSMIRAS